MVLPNSLSSYYEKFLATGEVKCIDDEIPFEIPKGWKWCRLGEISTYAQTKRKINASKADPQLWELDLEDIEKGGKLLSIKCVGDRKAIGDKTIFDCGDILYSKLRPYLLKILIAPQAGICTPEIIPFSCYGNICKDYIIAFLKTPYVDDYINSVTFGVKMPRVGTETMTSLLVPLPPITEQHRIAAKIQRIIPVIDRYEKAQETLDKLNKGIFDRLKKSILQEAIQGWPNRSSVSVACQQSTDEPASILLEQIRKEKLLLVKEGKLKKSALTDSVIFKGDDNKYWEKNGKIEKDITNEIPFEIPDSWVWSRLSNLVILLSGRDLESSQYNSVSKGIPYMTGASNFRNGSLIKNRWTETPIVISILGDLLITCKGTIGEMAFNSIGDIHIARQIMALRSSFVDLKYMQYYLSANIPELQKQANSMIPGISRDTLLNALVPLPPIREQTRIVSMIKRLASIMRG